MFKQFALAILISSVLVGCMEEAEKGEMFDRCYRVKGTQITEIYCDDATGEEVEDGRVFIEEDEEPPFSNKKIGT